MSPGSACRTPRSSRTSSSATVVNCETAKLFAAQKEHLAAVRPDVIVMFDTDHLNTFFLDNLPIFAVGVDKAFSGPNDEPREMPVYKIPSAVDLAADIRKASIIRLHAALTQLLRSIIRSRCRCISSRRK